MTEHTAANPALGYEGWAIVELMGHRQRAGYVKEAEMFGAKMLRLDIPLLPTLPPRLEWKDSADPEVLAYANFEQRHCFEIRKVPETHRYVAIHRDAGEGNPGGPYKSATTLGDRFYAILVAKAACIQHLDSIAPPPPEVPLAELPATTQFYGGPAIYCLTPCTEAAARAALERLGDQRPAAPLDFPEERKAITHSSYRDDEFESH
jgi:hypothetical protein